MATIGNATSRGFAPVIGSRTKVLILGSLPSQQSLILQEYYANPRNAFWRIMREIVALGGSESSYEDRCNNLINNGIALWDVLASTVRPGSLDSAIDVTTAVENDFPGLFRRHKGIKLVCFNGRKARDLFDRLVLKSLSLPGGCKLVDLPSSSPAHAALNFEEKLDRWSVIGRHLDPDDRASN